MILNPLQRLRQAREIRRSAQHAYTAIVARAREPHYYTDFAVADTVDGRFDMLVLQLFLYLQNEPNAQQLRQKLIECMIDDMDKSLREMGVGDMSVGKKVGKMAYAINGRLQAYEASWGNSEAFTQALWRNLYRSNEASLAAAKALTAHLLMPSMKASA